MKRKLIMILSVMALILFSGCNNIEISKGTSKELTKLNQTYLGTLDQLDFKEDSFEHPNVFYLEMDNGDKCYISYISYQTVAMRCKFDEASN